MRRMLTVISVICLLSSLTVVVIGCSEQKRSQPDKEGASYTELQRLLGTDISITVEGGRTTIEYCPDNTCEAFSMPSSNPTERLSDFVFLYLYSVSDYRALHDFRKKVTGAQVDKVIQRSRTEGNSMGGTSNAKDVVASLAQRYAIRAKFVRYDESKRNEVDIDIKTQLEKR